MVQSFVVRSVDVNNSETPASLSYTAEVSKPFVEKTSEPYSAVDETSTNTEIITEPAQELVPEQPKRAAKIHDFCFGIPYGTILLLTNLISNLSIFELCFLKFYFLTFQVFHFPYESSNFQGNSLVLILLHK